MGTNNKIGQLFGKMFFHISLYLNVSKGQPFTRSTFLPYKSQKLSFLTMLRITLGGKHKKS